MGCGLHTTADRTHHFSMKFDTSKTYFLAGATGTEIQRRGFPTTLPLWSAGVLFEKPELLVDIYRDYINAGADIITTNTFRTQRRTLALAGLESETERINTLAVDLAVEARGVKPVFIAGCMTTLEDCYRPDLVPTRDVCEAEHGAQARILGNTPIDFFLLETFNTISEAEIAVGAVVATGKPFAVSFVANTEGDILNGDTWEQAVERIGKYQPVALMVNCVPPTVATKALTKLAPLAAVAGIPCGVYANGDGTAGSDEGWDFSKSGSPIDSYVAFAKEWKGLGANLIGGCCGTSPEYTQAYTQI